jgi:hypothetical protein
VSTPSAASAAATLSRKKFAYLKYASMPMFDSTLASR